MLTFKACVQALGMPSDSAGVVCWASERHLCITYAEVSYSQHHCKQLMHVCSSRLVTF